MRAVVEPGNCGAVAPRGDMLAMKGALLRILLLGDDERRSMEEPRVDASWNNSARPG
jgi:hypothetical protein